MAIALAEAGARLALVSRDQKQLKLTAEAAKSAGGEAELFNADVTDEQQVQRLEADVIAKFGKVQILINNAGINIRKSVTDFALSEWRQVLDTNLTGVFLMCRSFVPHMKGQNYGRIINMTSIMSHMALPGRSDYAASKHGLLGFTRALRWNWQQKKSPLMASAPVPLQRR